jgi:hypothetical protein
VVALQVPLRSAPSRMAEEAKIAKTRAANIVFNLSRVTSAIAGVLDGR